jgi:hypothetical protein
MSDFVMAERERFGLRFLAPARKLGMDNFLSRVSCAPCCAKRSFRRGLSIKTRGMSDFVRIELTKPILTKGTPHAREGVYHSYSRSHYYGSLGGKPSDHFEVFF